MEWESAYYDTIYEQEQDYIVGTIEDYMEEEGYTLLAATSRTIEEFWREFRENLFLRTTYMTNIAIKCMELEELPAFLLPRLEHFLNVTEFDVQIDPESKAALRRDQQRCRELLEKKSYRVIDNEFTEQMTIVIDILCFPERTHELYR